MQNSLSDKKIDETIPNLYFKASFIYSILVTISMIICACNGGNGAMKVDGKGADWQTITTGGIAAVDEICQHDALNEAWIPANRGAKNMVWKAMIVDKTKRQALPKPINWVFTFNLKNVLGPQGDQYNWIPYGNTMYTWTGLNKEWKQDDSNCENWTYNTNKYGVGRLGVSYFQGNVLLDNNVVDFKNISCNRHDNLKGAFRLVCVSQ